MDGAFQHSQPEATNTSGTFEELRNGATARCVGVPSPSKMAYTLSCRTSCFTTDTVLVGSYLSSRYLYMIFRP